MKKIPYNIAGLLKDRILVLDGAMGTMIQKLKFDESEWCIEQSKELKNFNVPFLHYYSMGKSDNIKKVARAIF